MRDDETLWNANTSRVKMTRTQLAIRNQEARDGGHEDREIGETEECRHCKYILCGRCHREIIANNGRDVIFAATKVDFFKNQNEYLKKINKFRWTH